MDRERERERITVSLCLRSEIIFTFVEVVSNKNNAFLFGAETFLRKIINSCFAFLFQIIALNRENLPALRQDFPQEMSDLIIASDIYEILPSVSKVSLIT